MIFTGFVHTVSFMDFIMKETGVEDGLMDDHLVCFTKWKRPPVQDNGKEPPKGKDLAYLFTTVYSHHQAEVRLCLW